MFRLFLYFIPLFFYSAAPYASDSNSNEHSRNRYDTVVVYGIPFLDEESHKRFLGYKLTNEDVSSMEENDAIILTLEDQSCDFDGCKYEIINYRNYLAKKSESLKNKSYEGFIPEGWNRASLDPEVENFFIEHGLDEFLPQKNSDIVFENKVESKGSSLLHSSTSRDAETTISVDSCSIEKKSGFEITDLWNKIEELNTLIGEDVFGIVDTKKFNNLNNFLKKIYLLDKYCEENLSSSIKMVYTFKSCILPVNAKVLEMFGKAKNAANIIHNILLYYRRNVSDAESLKKLRLFLPLYYHMRYLCDSFLEIMKTKDGPYTAYNNRKRALKRIRGLNEILLEIKKHNLEGNPEMFPETAENIKKQKKELMKKYKALLQEKINLLDLLPKYTTNMSKTACSAYINVTANFSKKTGDLKEDLNKLLFRIKEAKKKKAKNGTACARNEHHLPLLPGQVDKKSNNFKLSSKKEKKKHAQTDAKKQKKRANRKKRAKKKQNTTKILKTAAPKEKKVIHKAVSDLKGCFREGGKHSKGLVDDSAKAILKALDKLESINKAELRELLGSWLNCEQLVGKTVSVKGSSDLPKAKNNQAYYSIRPLPGSAKRIIFLFDKDSESISRVWWADYHKK